ncbi:hypothetical protein VMUT_1009 [Vulcanisaeta moutnovskia 768-28]|uniref:Uncharacterized protein n=1 Tax=Vulcanisaeta moutnovskia (strain 768-28) TaxID=985053 RepID=F0QXQ3_VULM7|nr:hypothetical protein [Vulcanisaeta moutnovskia]ADY01216.1 hypothetical protein VMUT_1009 [Vulcanisaeta moutnovskia 768-28]
MSIDELFTGAMGFAIAMAIAAAVIGGLLYGYYLYVQNQVLANYLWPVVDVVPYKGGYYMAVINTGHEPFFVKAIFFSDGSHINVESKALHHNQAWFYQASKLPSVVMVCSAIKPTVCIIAKASGWSLVVDAPPDSGWVNITLIVDCWASGSVNWVGIGNNKGVSGSLSIDLSNSGYCAVGGWGMSDARDVFTYGPLLIEITYSYSVPQMSCGLEVIPSAQPILISKDTSPYSGTWSFTYMLIASPSTDLTIHIKCTYTQGYW